VHFSELRESSSGMTRRIHTSRSRLLVPILASVVTACAQQSGGRPQFEVASIRSSGDCTGGGQPQPGRLTLRCVTVRALIQMAYGYFANGVSYTANVLDMRAPAWTDSEHYDIVATAGGETRQAVIRGPMLQALLEERFRLRFHRETVQGPTYLLTVAKGGAKLSQMAEGSCLPGGAPPPCGTETRKQNGSILTVNVHGIGVGAFADGLLSQLAGRRVIDQTGLEGLFDFHVEYAPDTEAVNGGTVDISAPSLAVALQQQLGLKMTHGTGAVPVFVVDHVERPSAN
jgi:uncharacterized protein (TIGR03435 family)